MGCGEAWLAIVFVHKWHCVAPNGQREGGFVLGFSPRNSHSVFGFRRKCLIFRRFHGVFQKTVDNFVDIPGEARPKP